MNLYSVNLITNYNNGTNILDNNKQPNINKIKEYSDSIYKKLEKYKENNSVVNQDIDDSKFPIQLIPSSTDNYYADSDSWYYIKDSNIYAYIKLTIGKETYEYCYKGSIDNYQFGKC